MSKSKEFNVNKASETSTKKIFKLVTIGDSGTGKSSFIRRVHDNTFTDTFQSTMGIDYRSIKR